MFNTEKNTVVHPRKPNDDYISGYYSDLYFFLFFSLYKNEYGSFNEVIDTPPPLTSARMRVRFAEIRLSVLKIHHEQNEICLYVFCFLFFTLPALFRTLKTRWIRMLITFEIDWLNFRNKIMFYDFTNAQKLFIEYAVNAFGVVFESLARLFGTP